METLVQTAVNSHESRAFNAVAAAVPGCWARFWSSADNDPVKEINEQIASNRDCHGGRCRTGSFLASPPGRCFATTRRWLPDSPERQCWSDLRRCRFHASESRYGDPSRDPRKDSAKFGLDGTCSTSSGRKYIFYASLTPTLSSITLSRRLFAWAEAALIPVTRYRDDRCSSDIPS